MGRSIPVVLRGHSFPNKQTCTEYFSALLRDTPMGAKLEGHNADMVIELLRRHSEAEDKIGCGVDYIYVGGTPEYGGKCFHVQRRDGSHTDFSYRRCVDAKPVTMLSEWRQAARVAVREQIDEYRAKYFNGRPYAPSEVSGQLVGYLDCHVDHMPPNIFHALAAEFLRISGLEPSYAWLSPPADNNYVCLITDIGVALRWQDFHRSNAKLRIVTAHENLSMGSHRNKKEQ